MCGVKHTPRENLKLARVAPSRTECSNTLTSPFTALREYIHIVACFSCLHIQVIDVTKARSLLTQVRQPHPQYPRRGTISSSCLFICSELIVECTVNVMLSVDCVLSAEAFDECIPECQLVCAAQLLRFVHWIWGIKVDYQCDRSQRRCTRLSLSMKERSINCLGVQVVHSITVHTESFTEPRSRQKQEGHAYPFFERLLRILQALHLSFSLHWLHFLISIVERNEAGGVRIACMRGQSNK